MHGKIPKTCKNTRRPKIRQKNRKTREKEKDLWLANVRFEKESHHPLPHMLQPRKNKNKALRMLGEFEIGRERGRVTDASMGFSFLLRMVWTRVRMEVFLLVGDQLMRIGGKTEGNRKKMKQSGAHGLLCGKNARKLSKNNTSCEEGIYVHAEKFKAKM